MALCIGAIVFFVTAGHDPNAAPSCDGKAMDPGDRCLAIGHDGGGGYEEMQQAANEENDRYALLAQVLLGSGAVFVFLGGAMQIARAAGRTRRR
jgi:hypothetical protein